jgi:hypothetical protein
MGFRYRTTFLWKSFTTFCSSFSAGADKRSTTSVSTAKSLWSSLNPTDKIVAPLQIGFLLCVDQTIKQTH